MGKTGNSKKLCFLGLQKHYSDCRLEIKRRFSLEATTNLDNILKSRDITLPTKVYIVTAMVFPVVTCGCESWTIKKAEHWRIAGFELWCWRRLLRVPWTVYSLNILWKSWIFIGSPEYSLEGLMLKLQYFGHLMAGANSSILIDAEDWSSLMERLKAKEGGATEDEMVR